MDTSLGLAHQDFKPRDLPYYSPGFWMLTALAAHVPLAYLMSLSSLVATCHAFIVLFLGLWFIISEKEPFKLIFLTGYIAGSEVLWRMSKAAIFWEFGKYALAFLLILAIIRWRHYLSTLPVLYFLLLLPSMALTLFNSPLEQARNDISFHLSGPFVLAVAGCFFAGITLNLRQIMQLIIITMMPLICIAFLAVSSTYSQHITFTAASNAATSGGFGPNQVSAVLGLGALLCWISILAQNKISKTTLVMSGLLLVFLGQAFMTFSRGGVYNFILAASFATPYLLIKRQRKEITLIYCCLLLLLFIVIVIPKMNQFTGDMMSARYKSLNTTGRWYFIKHDLRLWQDNFFLGVGVGGVSSNSPLNTESGSSIGIFSAGKGSFSHTEYSRLLAEHGLFGFMALLILFAMFLRAFAKAPNTYARGLTLAFMIWSLAEMSHQSMRLAIISYLYALPFAKFEEK